MSIGLRHFTTTRGAKLDFTLLGLGTAPLGNFLVAYTEEECDRTIGRSWDAGLRYFDTAFWLRDPRLMAERRRLLKDSSLLFTDPLLEPVLPYDATVPLAAQARAMGAIFYPATAYFENADYVKLREVAVTVTASRAFAAALHAREASVTLTGRNLHTWTGYSGGDPEAGSYGMSGPGTPRTIADILTVPPTRSWTLRLDVTF